MLIKEFYRKLRFDHKATSEDYVKEDTDDI